MTKRKQYRAAPDPGTELEVALLGPGNKLHQATVVDAAAGGMRIKLVANHPADTALGTVYQVRLTSSALPAPIDTPAMIVHSEREAQVLVLGLRWLDWLGLQAVVPGKLATLFNLRQDPRLALDPSTPVEVILRCADDGYELRGVLLDLSRSGLSFSAPVRTQCTLGRSDECRVEFTPPGTERRFRFGANIRYRSLQGESLRYGVCFEREKTMGFAVLQEELEQYVNARLVAAMRDLVST